MHTVGRNLHFAPFAEELAYDLFPGPWTGFHRAVCLHGASLEDWSCSFEFGLLSVMRVLREAQLPMPDSS